ncbi:Zf-FLZ domain [Abeliophyllum distichum]|uniref:Zf-FLZ domain n=1 Tax=Abeliophyllum distichum TaxID=126358 RepID=A0ABD1Q0Y7_9LAMI
MKRSRLVRSSSMGGSTDFLDSIRRTDTQVNLVEKKRSIAAPSQANASKLVQAKASALVARQEQTSKVVEKPQKDIFTFDLVPHERNEDTINEWQENFLDACAFCKMKIDANQDTYMYGLVLLSLDSS